MNIVLTVVVVCKYLPCFSVGRRGERHETQTHISANGFLMIRAKLYATMSANSENGANGAPMALIFAMAVIP